MLDPVAAIGLAGNIVQFVDFSWKLIDEARDLYGSSSGASQEHDLLELIFSDLNTLNDKLTAPTALGAIPESLRNLASQCKDFVEQLFRILKDLKVKGDNRKWKSFLQALRTIWKKEQIEQLVKQLERLRDAMQFRLQIVLR